MYKLFIMAIAAAFAMGSCGSKSAKVGVDDIENPASAENPNAKKSGPLGNPVFSDTVFNFNKVQDGEQVQHRYTFKNTGKGDLIIREAHASCGCTTPGWTKDVIPPGGEGYVDATFNSSGRGSTKGQFNEKMITVNFENSEVEQIILKFRATVFSKTDQQDDHL